MGFKSKTRVPGFTKEQKAALAAKVRQHCLTKEQRAALAAKVRRHYRLYTDEQLTTLVAQVKNMAQLLRSLSLKIAGGNYANMKRTLQKLQIDCSHWTGQAWNSGQQLKDWSEYTRPARAKPHLIKKRGRKCESCGRKTWQGEPIPLELDHINGDRTDNREDNWRLNCPNCHALTPTWRGRKNKK